MFRTNASGRTIFGITAALGLLFGTALAAPKPKAPLTQASRAHRRASLGVRALHAKSAVPPPHAPAAIPGADLKPVPLLPDTNLGPPSLPDRVPFVFQPLPILRPSLSPQPQRYGGGGGNVILPSGGSFGGPPIAGGSFGGGQRTGGSFGNGRVP